MRVSLPQNNLSIPVNLQLSGGFVPLHNESVIDAPVEPGESVTYNWLVTESNGPAENDVSTVAYFYGSNVDSVADLNAGLYGAVVVARKVPTRPSSIPLLAPRHRPTGSCLGKPMLACFPTASPAFWSRSTGLSFQRE